MKLPGITKAPSPRSAAVRRRNQQARRRRRRRRQMHKLYTIKRASSMDLLTHA